MKLNCRIGHLQPTDINSSKEIVGKWRHLTAINDKIIDLVAPETPNGLPKDLGILNVPTIGYNLRFGLLGWFQWDSLDKVAVVGQESCLPARCPRQTLHGYSRVDGGRRSSSRIIGVGMVSQSRPMVCSRSSRQGAIGHDKIRGPALGTPKLGPKPLGVGCEYLAAAARVAQWLWLVLVLVGANHRHGRGLMMDCQRGWRIMIVGRQ